MPQGSLADIFDELPSHQLYMTALQTLLRQCLYAVEFLHDQEISHHNISARTVFVQSIKPLHIRIGSLTYARMSTSPPLLPWCLDGSTARYSDSVRNDIGLICTDTPGALETSSNDIVRRHLFGTDIWALGIIALNALGYWPCDGSVSDRCGVTQERLLISSTILPKLQGLPCTSLLNGMLYPECRFRYGANTCLEDPWIATRLIRKRRCSQASPADVRPPKRQRLFAVRLSDDCFPT